MKKLTNIVCNKDFLNFKEGLDLEIGPLTILMGENGCGKSTILNKVYKEYIKKSPNYFMNILPISDNFDIEQHETEEYSDVRYFNFHMDDMRFRSDFDYDNVSLQIASMRKSSGESIFLQSLVKLGINKEEIDRNVLYILDEPERGMSLKNQVKWKNIIINLIKLYDCSFIIASHSAVLPKAQEIIKDAKIYDLDTFESIQFKSIII